MNEASLSVPWPIVVALLGVLGTGLWFYFRKAGDAQNEKIKDICEEQAALGLRQTLLEKDHIRTEGKMLLLQQAAEQAETQVNKRSDDQDRMLRELLDGHRALGEAIAKKVSKDTWRAMTDSRVDPDSDPPPLPPMRPRLPSRRGE